MNTTNKLYARMKTSSLSLGVCPITGIIVTMDIPFIPGKVYTYKNPLAMIENARGIALLSYKDQSKISPHILSGCLLTILTTHNLIEDKLSSVERNDLLSQVPIYFTCSLLKFLASQSDKRISLFPHISFEKKKEEVNVSPTSRLKHYLSDCENCVLPSIYRTITQEQITRSPRQKKHSFTPEIKKELRELVSSLIAEETLSTKFVFALKYMTSKDNFITLSDEVKEKLIVKLVEIDNDYARKIAILIKDIQKGLSMQERLFRQDYDASFNTFSSYLPSLKKKRTLQEILAEKLTKKENEVCEARTQVEEIIEAEETETEIEVEALSFDNDNDNEFDENEF